MGKPFMLHSYCEPDVRDIQNLVLSLPALSTKWEFKGELRVFLNLDLISGMKYVHLITENSLVKVGVLQKIFRFLQIHITE